MKIVFRVGGGGNGIGLGHIYRCMAIAEAFEIKGVEAIFIVRNFPEAVRLLLNKGYEVGTISIVAGIEEDAAKTLSYPCDAIFTDAYELTGEYFSRLKAGGKVVIAIDDLLNRQLPVDLVIGNAWMKRDDYTDLILPDTVVLSGPEYLPLRKEFKTLPPHPQDAQLSKVLLTFGGEDVHDVAKKVLGILSDYPRQLILHILAGASYPYLPSLELAIARSPHICKLFHNIHNVVPIYQSADIAITAAGVSLWELAAVGTPVLIVQTADNQVHNVKYFTENSLGEFLGQHEDLNPEGVLNGVAKLEDKNERFHYSRKLQSHVDGKGTERIATAVFKAIHANEEVALRPANPDPDSEDSHLILEWRNDELTRQMSKEQDFISWENHKAWYAEKMRKPPSTLVLMAYWEKEPLGMVRFDPLGPCSWRINVNMNPEKRGQGWGRNVLKRACDYAFRNLDVKEIHAEIKPCNTASIRIFKEAGFMQRGVQEGMLKFILVKS